MNIDGTGCQRVGDTGGIPKLSPDGRQLLTISFTNPCELALLDLAGGERSIELAGHQFYSVPSWAASDTLTAVVRSAKGFSVALVDVTNPGEAQIKETLWKRGDGTNIEPLYPVYSPALRRGLFVGREKQGQSLYTFTPGKTPESLEPNTFDGKIASLALSPDGRYVLFSSDRAWPR
jgi:hypothetical protein